MECEFIEFVCSFRTWKNAQLGERIILQMESKSKEMTEEMNKTIVKLNEEASALEVEKEKKSVSSFLLCPGGEGGGGGAMCSFIPLVSLLTTT